MEASAYREVCNILGVILKVGVTLRLTSIQRRFSFIPFFLPSSPLLHLLCILQKLLQTDIRKRMVEQAEDRWQRAGTDVGAGFCASHDV